MEGHSSCARVCMIPHTFRRILHASSCIRISQLDSVVLSDLIVFRWDQSAPPSASHLCTKLDVDCWMSGHCAAWHLMNHNHDSYIWQLWEVSSRNVTCALPQIHHLSLVASPSLLPHLPNLACTFLQTHLNPLALNPFGIIKIIRRQQVVKCHQNICNRRHPVQGAISQRLQLVLSLNNRPMLLHQKPGHPCFLPVIEGAKVGLPHHFCKLLQGEFSLLQADWGNALSTTQVWQIVALIICIVLVIENLW